MGKNFQNVLAITDLFEDETSEIEKNGKPGQKYSKLYHRKSFD